MKKKILTILVIIASFFSLIPNIYAQDQGSLTCIYNDSATYGTGNDTWKKYLEVNFYGVGTATPSLGEIKYYSLYNNDINDKRIIFSYDTDSIDHYINYSKFIPGIEAQYRYASSMIISSMAQGTTAINDNNKELICPSKMMILEKTIETGKWNPLVANEIKTSYDLYACGNNYGSYNNDTCPITQTFLKEYKKTANHDGSEAVFYTTYYYTGNLISNVGQKDPTKTNAQEQYNENQQNIEKYCDKESENYNTEDCEKAEVAQDSHVEQTEGNLGITKDQLEKGYGEFKAQNSLIFEEASCDTLLGDTKYNPNAKVQDPAYYLNFAFNLIKYAAIILLFVLTIVEYAKAVASSNGDALKKATQITIKRLLIAVVIFLLPILINFILRLLGIISTNGTCGIGV